MKQPHRSLERKFAPSLSAGGVKSRVPVSSSLQHFLQSESFRIQKLLHKKEDQQKKVQRIATANLNYREQLRRKIIEQQKKHQKNRQEVLTKRVKQQAFKVKEVIRKKGQYEEKELAKFKTRVKLCEQSKTQSKNYWTKKSLERTDAFESQSGVQPLYEDVIQRKKFMELRNQGYADLIQNQVTKKHKDIKERVQAPVREYKQYLHAHNFDHVSQNQERHSQFLNSKEGKFVNDICFHEDRSKGLLKDNLKKHQKRIKGKKIDEDQLIIKNRENFKSRQMQRTKSMKECRCHDRGKFSEGGLTQSITFNEEESPGKQKSNIKINTNANIRNWSVMSMRQSMMKSQYHAQNVKNKKEYLRERKDIKDENKLTLEKDITNAIDIRNSIKNQSNCYVRNARMLQAK